MTTREISLLAITPSRWQPRTTFGPIKLLELATSIRDHGLLVPLTVFESAPDVYELVAGERRTRALHAVHCAAKTGQPLEEWIYRVASGSFWNDRQANRYGYHEYLAGVAVPALVVAEDLDAIQSQILVELVQREDVSPLDRARALQRLMVERGYNQAQLAVELGVSQATVSLWLAILDTDESVQQALMDELISYSAVGPIRALPRADQPHVILAIRAGVAKGDLAAGTVERVIKLCRRYRQPARVRGSHKTKPSQTTVLDEFGTVEELALRLEYLADALRQQAAWAEQNASQNGQSPAWRRMALWLRNKADYAQKGDG